MGASPPPHATAAYNSDFAAAYQALDRVAEIDPDELGIHVIRPLIDDLAFELD